MRQAIIGGLGAGVTLDTAAVRYSALSGTNDWQLTELNACQVVSTPGTLDRLFIELDNGPGGATSYTFHVMVNGVASGITVVISGAATSGSDVAHSVAVAAGDYISLRSTPAGPPIAAVARYSIRFTGTNARESLILGSAIAALNAGATAWNFPACTGATWLGFGGADLYRLNICPTGGSIKNLYVRLSASPGVNPDGYRFTLEVNSVATTLTCTVTDPATTASDLVNSVAVVAGDRLSLKCEPLNGPAATPTAHWGMAFVATIDGESLVLGGNSDELNPAATEYAPIHSRASGWTANELATYQLGQTCTLRKLYVWLSGTPGVGNSYTLSVRRNVGATTLTVTIAGLNTTGNDVVHDVVVADSDELALESIPAVAPTARWPSWGMVSYQASGAVAPRGGSNAAKLVAVGII